MMTNQAHPSGQFPARAGWSDRNTLIVSLSLTAAAIAVACLYAAHIWNASRVIDGVRWFWLDDDMMIAMRYARNLIEGHGLVFNPGEPIEGYTNLGWVLVMALVHLLPLTDQTMPVAMTCVSGVIYLCMLVVAARLHTSINPRLLTFTLPAALILIVGCTDVTFWAVSGFETILLTALHLGVVLRVVSRRRADGWLLICLALIPVVRSDALVLWFGDAVLTVWLSTNRRQTIALIAATLIPVLAQFAFRWSYYRDVFPNTYYLKVVGLDNRLGRGLTYVGGFLQRYALPLVFAAGTAVTLWRTVPATRSLVTSVLPALAYSAYVGGDNFQPFRFFAHVMPEIFIWAAIGAATITRYFTMSVAWLLALVVIVAAPRIANPMRELALVGDNGDPYQQVVVAAQLAKNADPLASVAVIPAGIVPYFTGLRTIDFLGKTDLHVARLEPVPGASIGHGKVDPAYSLGLQPDYVVSARPYSFAEGIKPIPLTKDYVYAILASPEFQAHWRPSPVNDPFLLEQTSVYVRTDSPELSAISRWQGVDLEP